MAANSISPVKETQIKQINYLFLSLVWTASRRLAQRLQAFELTQSQFMVLLTLATQNQACSMRELAKATVQVPPTISRIIEQLVNRQLVTRTMSSTDRRVTFIQATQAGLELVNEIQMKLINDNFEASQNVSLECLANGDLTTIEQILQYLKSLQTDGVSALQLAKERSRLNTPAEVEPMR